MYKMHALPTHILRTDLLPLVREDTKLGDDVVIVDGKPVKRDPEKLWILGNIQPLSGTQLNLVPEGDRETENLCLRSETAFGIGDKVMFNGYVYQVQEIAPWGSYWEGRIMRVDTDANAASEFDNMPTKPDMGRRLY